MFHDFLELEAWIDAKLAKIANRLPWLVKNEPSSFSCGHNTGYKQALLDLCRELETDDETTKDEQ